MNAMEHPGSISFERVCKVLEHISKVYEDADIEEPALIEEEALALACTHVWFWKFFDLAVRTKDKELGEAYGMITKWMEKHAVDARTAMYACAVAAAALYDEHVAAAAAACIDFGDKSFDENAKKWWLGVQSVLREKSKIASVVCSFRENFTTLAHLCTFLKDNNTAFVQVTSNAKAGKNKKRVRDLVTAEEVPVPKHVVEEKKRATPSPAPTPVKPPVATPAPAPAPAKRREKEKATLPPVPTPVVEVVAAKKPPAATPAPVVTLPVVLAEPRKKKDVDVPVRAPSPPPAPKKQEPPPRAVAAERSKAAAPAPLSKKSITTWDDDEESEEEIEDEDDWDDDFMRRVKKTMGGTQINKSM
jgi:hypothetical protein